jgi:carbon storage regulator CsrA
MLVLSRKGGEKIHIGDNVVLTVLYIDPKKTRLGIKTDGNVRVVRQ